MTKLEKLVQEFEALDAQEKAVISGGFATTDLSDASSKEEDGFELNFFQCGCNNYQCGTQREKGSGK